LDKKEGRTEAKRITIGDVAPKISDLARGAGKEKVQNEERPSAE